MANTEAKILIKGQEATALNFGGKSREERMKKRTAGLRPKVSSGINKPVFQQSLSPHEMNCMVADPVRFMCEGEWNVTAKEIEVGYTRNAKRAAEQAAEQAAKQAKRRAEIQLNHGVKKRRSAS